MEETPWEMQLDSTIATSPRSSLSPSTYYEVSFESSASLIAQQQLNDARKAFLASSSLPENHDFRKRANEADGTLLPIQPDGTPRKVYDHHKIPKPRPRKDKEAAAYFLQRHRLVSMWNGKYSDWEAWDRSREKMEKQFSNYRLVEQPAPRIWQAQEYQKREKKRKRESEPSEYDSPSKKRCCEDDGAMTQTAKPPRQFPTPDEVLALTPLEGIRIELLLARFFGCEGYDTERFCAMLNEIGNVNKYTKMFTVVKRLDIGHPTEGVFVGGSGDIPIDPVLLNMSSGNACIKASRVEAC